MLSPKLLVVDDDPSVLAAYRLILQKGGSREVVPDMFGLDALEAELFGSRPSEQPEWRVDFAEQGIDAVGMVRSAVQDGDPYLAIFLDVRMPPGIDGYETAKRIRGLDPKTHITIVSGYSDYTYEQFVGIAGPEPLLSFMPKPLWPDQLRKLARSLASERHHRVGE